MNQQMRQFVASLAGTGLIGLLVGLSDGKRRGVETSPRQTA